MSWVPPTKTFEVSPPAVAPWAIVDWPAPKPDDQPWHHDEGLKRLFGIALAKHQKPFEAGCEAFGADTNRALWVSFHWITDPVVLAARDAYAETAQVNEKLLDKNALAAKLLQIANEKDPSGRFYVLEGKDRIATLKLYAEVQGFLNKVNIDASTNTFTNNELKLVLVKATAQKEELKPTIIEPEEDTVEPLPINLKLVKSA